MARSKISAPTPAWSHNLTGKSKRRLFVCLNPLGYVQARHQQEAADIFLVEFDRDPIGGIDRLKELRQAELHWGHSPVKQHSRKSRTNATRQTRETIS
jgi:hypothetical protein